jgi:hypothetical protein
MASIHQTHVANYHAAISTHAAHGGHDMYLFHRDWHQNNRNPVLPTRPSATWGSDIAFGSNFLQMHHEMVKAPQGEAHQHMTHESLAQWYLDQGLSLPRTWNPKRRIPAALGYQPDPNVFPTEIRDALELRAQELGQSVVQVLTRRTNTPAFELPRYFTLSGIRPGESAERITGARKLADFLNSNQLGSCLVFPHDQWHVSIGGAMASTWTAIADPIFYHGVHWQIDRVFDDFKAILAARTLRALDRPGLARLNALESSNRSLASRFNSEEQAWIDAQPAIGARLHSL